MRLGKQKQEQLKHCGEEAKTMILKKKQQVIILNALCPPAQSHQANKLPREWKVQKNLT